MFGCIIEDDATGGMAGRVNNLPAVGAEGDGIAVSQILVDGWHIQMDGNAQDLARLLLHLLHEETIVLMRFRFQTEGTEDKAVAHAVVEMAVGTEQVAGRELLITDIIDNGLTFFRIIGPAIDDDTLARLVADDIAVLSEHITGEAFDGEHRSAGVNGGDR